MKTNEVLDVIVDGDNVKMYCKLCDAHCEVFSNTLRHDLSPELKRTGIRITADRIARDVIQSHNLAKSIVDSMRGIIGDNSGESPDIPDGKYPYDMKH